MKIRLRLIAWLMSLVPLGLPATVLAEGSKQLTPNTAATAGVALNNTTNTRSGWLEHDANFANNVAAGNASRGFLKPFGYNYNGVVFSEDHRLYIRIKAGEYLYYGVHRINNVNNNGNQNDLILTLKYGAGAGTQVQQTTLTRNTSIANTGTPIWQSLLNAQAGVINDAAQNQFGPSITTGDGGYNPLIYQNTTGADQDFYVEFTQVNETALNERNRFSTYDFWDFTVRTTNTAAGVEKQGRLYSKQWAFSAGADNGVFSSTFNMFPMIPSIKEPGKVFVKKFELAGLNPQNYFRFTTNSRGTTASATNFSVSRKSQTTLADYPEYSSFVNDPDNAIWPSATDPTFAVNNITPYCAGANGGLVFTTTSSEAGQLIITLNLDGVAGYQAGGRDVFIEQTVPAGKSSVAWNGRDGLNAAVAQNTSIDIAFKSSVSPLNFPMVDAENNVDGFVVNSIRPGTTFNLLFWDDSNLDVTKFPAAATPEANGQNSSAGVHKWGGTAAPLLDAGNQYTVNTYTYVTINTANQTVVYRYVCDKDADGVADNVDIDKDNDGITDSNESNGVNPLTLTVAGVPTYLDAAYVDPTYGAFRDANNDGINDIFDFDLDGIPNFLDIDADADGIPDAIEANGGVVPTGYDATLSRFPSTGVGTNGMPDIAETTAGSGVSKLPTPNTDNTGRPDFLDIDADDDGIVDNVEAQTTAGYRAPTGTDTDGDGLDNRYDLTPGTGITAGVAVTLPNSEPSTGTDALPDYIDTNSDNDGRSDAVEARDFNNDGIADVAFSGVDADGDGLDDAYDATVSTASFDATNGGKTPQSYADVQNPGGDRDWRQNVPPVATNVTSQPISNGAAATAIPALIGTDPDGPTGGANLTYTVGTIPNATTQGTLTILNTAGTGRTTVTSNSVIPLNRINTLQYSPVVTFSGNYTFTYTATESSATGGQVSNTATYTIPVGPTTTLSGIIFDDVNYGGGAGRSLTTAIASATGFTAATIGRTGATVELYDDQGNFIATTTSGANGAYQFTGVVGVVGGKGYQVRVVTSTVTPARTATGTPIILGVQTLAYTDVNRVGGENPTLADAPARTAGQTLANLTTATATPQSLAPVTVSATTAASPTPVLGVDFGFNFDAVTNTNDSGAGSLRQFIINANALSNANLNQVANATPATGTTAVDPALGIETAIFMMNDGRTTGAPAGLRNGLTAPSGYNSTTKQFTITLASALPIVLDASTAIDGKEQTAVTGDNVAASAETTTGPEVVIDFNSFSGLEIRGASARIASLGIMNANGDGGFTQGASLYLNGSINSTVTDVTATGNFSGGIRLNNADGAVITTNVILGYATQNTSADGIQLTGGTSGVIITGNTLSNNRGNGIEFIAGANDGNVISGNTIRNNNNTGITITVGSNNLFRQNIITGSGGDGIGAANGTSGNRFTENSFSANGGVGSTNGFLGIDLASSTNGGGVSINDDTDADAGANGLLNFPVIMQVANDGTNLRFLGYAPANSLVEFFVADVAGTGFGEGNTFLVARTEGLAGEDTDNGFGYYSGLISGVNQGREDNISRFLFTVPLSSLTAPQLAALTVTGARITATATILNTVNGLIVGNTSEFSGNTIVNAGPLPVELKEFAVRAVKVAALLDWSTASEKNSDRFEIERSLNGTSFEKIGTVRGQGTSQATTTYTFTDASIGTKTQGVVYYRLRQVDTNGSGSYSPVRTVRFEAQAAVAAKLTVFPNPATTSDRVVTLDLSALPKGTYQATLLDVTGRPMGSYSVEGGINKGVDVQTLPSGTYLLLVRGNGLNLSQRLIKE